MSTEKKHHLDEKHVVFFVDVFFDQPVHVVGGGLGYTNYLPTFSVAETAIQAEQEARQYYEAKGVAVSKVRARKALLQDINRYAFPEAMIGYSGWVH